ncbi:unnamed protein product [Prunus armeniaca]|uniref:Uncharacterized protein n=1 Tax=Prunus armeniaca TaxID=36596 RepID=A0A6J5V549_PRUAR|nr:unnamed protein product [Prunus armeniaca]
MSNNDWMSVKGYSSFTFDTQLEFDSLIVSWILVNRQYRTLSIGWQGHHLGPPPALAPPLGPTTKNIYLMHTAEPPRGPVATATPQPHSYDVGSSNRHLLDLTAGFDALHHDCGFALRPKDRHSQPS